MANATDVRIKGVDYRFWSYGGVISAVRNKSETQVWSSGGGGYVDSQYGGTVHAPTVHSRTDHWKEVRLDGDDGKAHSFTLPDNISLFPGDRASIVYAKPTKHKLGYVHAVRNHREELTWALDIKSLAKPEYRKTVGGLVMRFWSKGFFSWVAATLIVTLLDGVRHVGPRLLIEPEWLMYHMQSLVSPYGLEMAAIMLCVSIVVWSCTGIARKFSSRAIHKAVVSYAQSLPTPRANIVAENQA